MASLRTQAKLLQELPWLTDLVLRTENLVDPTDSDPNMQAFPLKVLEVEEELRGNSADVEYARKLLGFPEHTTASASLQSSVAPSLNLNSHYMTTAIQRIMAYRVLDVMHWVKQGGPRKEGELRLPRSYLKGVPTLEILKSRDMKNWPAVIKTASKCLSSLTIEPRSVSSSKPEEADVIRRLFASINATKCSTKKEKILSNIEIAAAHLATHIKGGWTFEMQSAEGFDSTAALVGGSNNNNMSFLSVPLHLASAMSPLILLQPKLIWNAKCANYAIIDSFKLFGQNKPQVLADMELVLWAALNDIACGTSETVPRIAQALDCMENIMSTQGFPDSVASWFGDRISQGQAYLEGRDSATSLIGPHSHQSNLAVAVPRQLRGTSSSGNNAHAITPPTSHVGSAGLSSLGAASVALTEPRHPIDSGNANAAVNFDKVTHQQDDLGMNDSSCKAGPVTSLSSTQSPDRPDSQSTPSTSNFDFVLLRKEGVVSGPAVEQAYAPAKAPVDYEHVQNLSIDPRQLVQAPPPPPSPTPSPPSSPESSSPRNIDDDQPTPVLPGMDVDTLLANESPVHNSKKRAADEMASAGQPEDSPSRQSKRTKGAHPEEEERSESGSNGKGVSGSIDVGGAGSAQDVGGSGKGKGKGGTGTKDAGGGGEADAGAKGKGKAPSSGEDAGSSGKGKGKDAGVGKKGKGKASSGSKDAGGSRKGKGKDAGGGEKGKGKGAGSTKDAGGSGKRNGKDGGGGKNAGGKGADSEKDAGGGGQRKSAGSGKDASSGQGKANGKGVISKKVKDGKTQDTQEGNVGGDTVRSFIDLTIPIPRCIDAMTVVHATPLEDPVSDKPSKMPRITFPCNSERVPAPTSVDLYGPTCEKIVYKPNFHCQSDLDAFYKMMQLVESDYQNGLPYHITSPLSSLFRIFQCNPLSDAVAAKWLSEGCVLQDVPQGCIEFDRTTLQELFGKCNNIHMIDYMHSDARDTIGSLDDLITSHQATVGHILATTQIAMPFSQFSPPPMMATDLRAWADMLDYPFCKRRISFPFSQTRWGMASTAGAFTDWIVPSDGLCTYFQILHGKQFVVVVTPREKIHMFPIRPPSDDIDFWEYEGMLVKAGQMVVLQPGVQYRVLSLASTITVGGVFYSMNRILDSCAGFIDTFLRGNCSSGHATRTILQRIILYVVDAFLEQGMQMDQDPHLPDLLTHSGLYSVFSLINIAELSNVLHPDTYGAGVPPQERLFLIHVRMRARMLRAWITARYLITRMTNGKSKRYHADALADGHLVYQTAAMRTRKVTYDTANVIHGVPAFNAQDLDRELDLCSPGLTKDHPTSSTLPCLSHSTKYEDIKIQAYSTPGLVSTVESGETISDKQWKKSNIEKATIVTS